MPPEVWLGGRGLRSRERVRTGIERLVAEELEDGAVERIRTRLGHDVHLSCRPPELRRVDAGLHLEFLERVDRGQEDVGVEVDVRVVDTI